MAVLQLGLLMLAIPAQYLLMKYTEVPDVQQRNSALRRLLSSAVGFKAKYLSWQTWQKWCIDMFGKVQSMRQRGTGQAGVGQPNSGQTTQGESPATEVLQFRDPNGYFAGSTDIRSPRPSNIKYRIGQVVKHKTWGYRGVIIGWDPVAKAPDNWLREMHPADKHHWRTMPNYAILVDTRDRQSPQRTYVPEENIEIISNSKIIHPELDDYFEQFDGAQYLPRPWLLSVYPHD